MKKLLCIAALLGTGSLQAQNNIINTCPAGSFGPIWIMMSPNNNTDSCKKYVSIDQTQPQNLWQIGAVSKTVFTTGYNGGTKVLVTDTVNSYPANNTSSFTIKLSNCFWVCCNWGAKVTFTHKYNTEVGVDGGMVEYSYDAGLNWNNVVQNSGMCWSNIYAVSNAVTSLSQPGFSGNSNGWVTSELMMDYNGGQASNAWLRFTFGSNGTVSGDGWMIGDLQIMDMYEGIETYGNTRVVAVSPNPARNEVELKPQTPGSVLKDLSVFDNAGRTVLHFKEFRGGKLDVFSLPSGFYSIRYTESEMHNYSRFVKQ